MTKRGFLNQLAALVVGGAFALVVRDIILDRDADRRFALYNIMRELRKGMSRSEVESIISRHDAPYINKHIADQSIILSIKLGGIDMLYLSFEFGDGMLNKAKFSGEDNPRDVPKDVPSNIE